MDTWRGVAACCRIVINRELLFFHLDVITQGARPDRHGPRSQRLMDEDERRDPGVKTWMIINGSHDCQCGVSQSYSGIINTSYLVRLKDRRANVGIRVAALPTWIKGNLIFGKIFLKLR